jgi:hypothetical protein
MLENSLEICEPKRGSRDSANAIYLPKKGNGITSFSGVFTVKRQRFHLLS